MITTKVKSLDWIRGYAFRDLEGKFLKIFKPDGGPRKASIEIDIPKVWFDCEHDYLSGNPAHIYVENVYHAIEHDLSIIFKNYRFSGEISPNKQYMNFRFDIVNCNPIPMTQEEIEEALGYKIRLVNVRF